MIRVELSARMQKTAAKLPEEVRQWLKGQRK